MKNFKFIQINIYKGKYLENLLDFLIGENPDAIAMQEVTVGAINPYKDKVVNLFDILKNELKMDGVFESMIQFKDLKNSLLGSAIFTKFPIAKSQVITLKTFRPVTLDEVDGSKAFIIRPQLARNLIDVVLRVNNQNVHAMCWHGAWTAPPTDTLETLRQAKIVAGYLKSLNDPFILGGDLNNTIESETVGLINAVAKNLMFGVDAKATTHPKVHRIAPRGFLIDYIFVSKHFKLKRIDVPEVTVSDHLPVVAEVEIAKRA